MSDAERWTFPRGLVAPAVMPLLPHGPLQLFERGVWEPALQYWGEPEGMMHVSLAQVIAGGPREEFEFEQIEPGDDDPDDGPILHAIALRDHGQEKRAVALLQGLLEQDVRCLDAYAHLGSFAFQNDNLQAALAHYATGVYVGERSLPDPFNGVLPWGWIDNRPFLRCLHGLLITSWRLEESDVAETLAWALLWLNPSDNQGARELLPDLIAAEPWPPEQPVDRRKRRPRPR